MDNKHNIETYSKLAEATNFFLNEAFHYLNEAFIEELAGLLFSKELEKIDPTDEDREIVNKLNLPENHIELFQTNIPNTLTEETIEKMSIAWNKSQHLARIEKHKFSLNHTIKSIELLGHLNNFGFFIETIVNRHLLFLKQSNFLDDYSYSRISKARVMERLIFIFKDDLKENKIHLNEISNLFSLRNKTVHYTPDNAIALKPKILELEQIWKQTVKVIQKLEKTEMFTDDKFSELLNEHIKSIKSKWE